MRGILSDLKFMLRHRRLPIRARYVRRADGRLRLRYTVMGYTAVSGMLSFMVMASLPGMSVAPTAMVQVAATPTHIPTASAAPIIIPMKAELAMMRPAPVVPLSKPGAPILDDHRDDQGQIRRPNIEADDPGLRDVAWRSQNLTIAAGDTLSTLMIRAGMSADDADRAITAMRPHVRPSDLRPGQTMQLELSTADAPYHFNRLALNLDPVRTLEVQRGWGGFMSARIVEKALKRDIGAHSIEIKASLYGAAVAAGVPSSVTAEAIKAFGHQFDFQRDIHPGDRLEIMYDRMVTPDGYVAKTGNLQFARLIADGRDLTIYRFEDKSGRVDYFDQKGHSIRKALLRTPLDGVRITSGFGMRKHPILGYSKMHKGVDFGAPTGTPIYAAGDGVVEKSGRFGAYGHYIRLKHNSRLSTAYAHLSRYASGIRPGARVRQGQVIGYVGSTGRSTGPHLHYEVIVGGQAVNPQSMNLPTMTVLEGSDKKNFQAMVERVQREFRDRVNGIRYAATENSAL